MKADRMVSILLMLQRFDRVTATQVATELEISERTARRDLDALAMAGLPVYAERGRNGGWRLLGGAKTDLSGLTSAEARALFAVAGPSAETSPQVRAALRKLVRALPEPFRATAETAAGSVVHDPTSWDRLGMRPRPQHLDAIQAAVVDQAVTRLGYRDGGGKESVRELLPLGTALKGNVWYLLANTDAGLRTFRVDRIVGVDLTGETRDRPAGFDLDSAWRQVIDRVEELRAPVELTVEVEQWLVRVLRWIFQRRLSVVGETDDGRAIVTLRGESIHVVSAQIAGFGQAARVTAPPEARDRLAVIGAELVATYGV